MRKFPLILAAGALALVGTAALAAGGPNFHTLTVKLPDGGVAKMEYSGNVPPKVNISAGTHGDFAAFAPGPTFGLQDFAKIEAAMDRQMNDMLRQAHAMMAMAAKPNAPFMADFGVIPGGDAGWFISNSKGSSFCARSIEVTVVNVKKTVRSHTEGKCGSPNGSADNANANVAPSNSI